MYYTNEALEQFCLRLSYFIGLRLSSISIRYQAEGIPAKQSMQEFCSANKVPYNIFLKWYKDTRRKIVPVKISDTPEEPERESTDLSEATSTAVVAPMAEQPSLKP